MVEGYSQALDNDVVLSMKQANVPALSRFVDTASVDAYFEHEAHAPVISQRALQVHTDPLLEYTTLDGVGYVISESRPTRSTSTGAGITEPAEIAAVVGLLGRATARSCASDEDSDQDLVDFQVGRRSPTRSEVGARQFTEDTVEFQDRLRAAQRAEDHRIRGSLPREQDRRSSDLSP